jgi:hypothetical protein
MIVKLLNVEQLACEIIQLTHRMKNDQAEFRLRAEDGIKLEELGRKLACEALAIKKYGNAARRAVA